MQILLIGEYSGFHNTLKKGFEKLGHSVTLVGDGDQYKNYAVDISTRPKLFNKNWLLERFKNLVYKVLNIDLLKVEQGLRYLMIKSQLKNYDIVQLINSDALNTYTWLAKPTLNYIFKNNTKIILSACGDDTPFVDWLLNNNEPYHLLTPYLNGTIPKKKVQFSLKYITKPYRKQYNFIKTHVAHIIPTDMDYYISLKDKTKVSQLIPLPIDINALKSNELNSKNPIVIFHGISTINYHKKGNWYFEQALDVIKQRYGQKIKIITTKSLSYTDYIKAYDDAHILLDQVYSYDQGYNALEAMAKGKVVFTGAEDIFYDHYALNSRVCINAKPNVDYLVEELTALINSPAQIEAISKKAQAFVEEFHNIGLVTKQYLEVYNS